jgi:hypothetical protein
MSDIYRPPSELVLGTRLNARVPEADQKRQRAEVEEILRRLRNQPGVILADEVGMGKTFVALAIAYGVAVRSPRGPVIVMVPANLVDKWEQDLKTFCELYLDNRHPVPRDGATRKDLTNPKALRYGVVRHSVDLMKLLDDPTRERCHLIFLAQGAMGRRQTDKWIRLALIAEALRRHGRGKASRLIQVKNQIHRFLAELLWAIGEERTHDWGEELWQRLLSTGPETWKDTYNKAVRDERRRLVDDPVPKAVARALQRIDLKPLAEALEEMPVRARGGDARVSERLDIMRQGVVATRLSRPCAPGLCDITRALIGLAQPSLAANVWTARQSLGMMSPAVCQYRRINCCPSFWLHEVLSAQGRTCSAKRFVPLSKPSGSRGRVGTQPRTSRTSCQRRLRICPTPVGT